MPAKPKYVFVVMAWPTGDIETRWVEAVCVSEKLANAYCAEFIKYRPWCSASYYENLLITE